MAQVQIQDLNHTHEGILRWLIAHPDRPLRDCAQEFGVTQSWLSVVINSDLFRVRLAELQQDHTLRLAQTLEEKLATAADLALEKLIIELETTQDSNYILSAADKLLKSKGFGAKAAAPSVQVNNYNVQGVDANFLAQQRNALVERKVPEGVEFQSGTDLQIEDVEPLGVESQSPTPGEAPERRHQPCSSPADSPSPPPVRGKLTPEDLL